VKKSIENQRQEHNVDLKSTFSGWRWRHSDIISNA